MSIHPASVVPSTHNVEFQKYEGKKDYTVVAYFKPTIEGAKAYRFKMKPKFEGQKLRPNPSQLNSNEAAKQLAKELFLPALKGMKMPTDLERIQVKNRDYQYYVKDKRPGIPKGVMQPVSAPNYYGDIIGDKAKLDALVGIFKDAVDPDSSSDVPTKEASSSSILLPESVAESAALRIEESEIKRLQDKIAVLQEGFEGLQFAQQLLTLELEGEKAEAAGIPELRTKIIKSNAQILTIDNEKVKLNKQLDLKSIEHNGLEKKIGDLEKQINDLDSAHKGKEQTSQKEISDLKALVEVLNKRKVDLDKQILGLQNQIRDLNDRLTDLGNRKNEAEQEFVNQIANHKNDLQLKKNDSLGSAERLRVLNEELELAKKATEDAVTTARSKEDDFDGKIKALESELDITKIENTDLKGREESLQKERVKLNEQLLLESIEHNDLKKKIVALGEELENLKSQTPSRDEPLVNDEQAALITATGREGKMLAQSLLKGGLIPGSQLPSLDASKRDKVKKSIPSQPSAKRKETAERMVNNVVAQIVILLRNKIQLELDCKALRVRLEATKLEITDLDNAMKQVGVKFNSLLDTSGNNKIEKEVREAQQAIKEARNALKSNRLKSKEAATRKAKATVDKKVKKEKEVRKALKAATL